MIVVDASVAVKWLLWEEDSERALEFFRIHKGSLIAPELIFVEVAAAIVRRGNMDKALHGDVLTSLQKWTVSWSAHAVDNVRVTQARLYRASCIALDLGTPLKDCIYLAVAMEKEIELVTCDARFRNKAASLYPRVRLLAEHA